MSKRPPQDASAPDRQLIDALLSPRAYPHPVTRVELVETHISWVLLTDEYAYKIKKPVDLGFVDFSTLERRRHFCEEELRLNKPWAPDLYLDVVAITDTGDGVAIDGAGETLEYALRMRRFDETLRLDEQLARGLLTEADMKELGQVIAARHASAAIVPAEQRDRQVATTIRFIEDNFRFLHGHVDPTRLRGLIDWSESSVARSEALLRQRFDTGHVRDCHGDLHLGNLVRLPDGIATFDCIEFDPELREIDTVCDMAFLVMDLVARDRHDLAAHFLNRYLECSGDYNGIALLDLFFVYRCLVRAKVAAIGLEDSAEGPTRDQAVAELERYCDMAERQAHKRPPLLVVMHGVSGTGKTWLSTQLMAALPAIRIRSDVERKRMAGLAETASSESPVAGGLYAPETTAAVYGRLLDLAELSLTHSHIVILDAAFLVLAQRQAAFELAERLGLAAVLIDLTAPPDLLRRRIRERAELRKDASESDARVLDHQLRTRDALTAAEERHTVHVDMAGTIDIDLIVSSIRDRRNPV